jgi:DNA-binding CsgD family transcriptional regulator
MTSTAPKSFGLNDRELNLLRYFAAGYSEQAAAERFRAPLNTIRARRKSILRKLGASNRAHAVAFGYEWRLLLVDPNPQVFGPSERTTIGQVDAWRRREGKKTGDDSPRN